MTARETLIEQFSKSLGNQFNYYYDTNQSRLESECMYIHFRFQPTISMSESKKQEFFELKLTELQKSYLQYDICGGNVMWFGYILTINLTTLEDLKKIMSNTKLEYEHRMKRLEEQIEVFKNKCVY